MHHSRYLGLARMYVGGGGGGGGPASCERGEAHEAIDGRGTAITFTRHCRQPEANRAGVGEAPNPEPTATRLARSCSLLLSASYTS